MAACLMVVVGSAGGGCFGGEGGRSSGGQAKLRALPHARQRQHPTPPHSHPHPTLFTCLVDGEGGHQVTEPPQGRATGASGKAQQGTPVLIPQPPHHPPEGLDGGAGGGVAAAAMCPAGGGGGAGRQREISPRTTTLQKAGAVGLEGVRPPLSAGGGGVKEIRWGGTRVELVVPGRCTAEQSHLPPLPHPTRAPRGPTTATCTGCVVPTASLQYGHSHMAPRGPTTATCTGCEPAGHPRRWRPPRRPPAAG